MSIACPAGARASSRAFAPPVATMDGAPEAEFTTPMSFMKTPFLNPVPTALENASLAAKRFANVPAAVKGRDCALPRSTSVKTRLRNRSPKRSSEDSMRSMLHKSEPMPTITSAAPACAQHRWREPLREESSRAVHHFAHCPDALLQSAEN